MILIRQEMDVIDGDLMNGKCFLSIEDEYGMSMKPLVLHK